MSDEQSSGYQRTTSQHQLTVRLFGPLKLGPGLNRETQRAIKANVNERDYFTDITLSEVRGEISVNYLVTAKSRDSALRVGTVYLSQLCDLLSVVTESPVQFFVRDEDAREERGRNHRQPLKTVRTLKKEEWDWVTGSLAALRREHPRFLAAASWFRKGLVGGDCLENFCCFFRVIDRMATTYADSTSGLLNSVTQLTSDIFAGGQVPALLADVERLKKVKQLRNDISHGNEPITVDMIEYANEQLPDLQDAAFCVLDCMRERNLNFDL